jgi:hypothetical protein
MQNYPELFEEKRGKFTEDLDEEDDGADKGGATAINEKSEPKDTDKDAKPVTPTSDDEKTEASATATSSPVDLSDVKASLEAVELTDSSSGGGDSGTTAAST